MFSFLCEKVRVLTLKITDLVADKQIEQCLNALEERQVLLEKLAQVYQEATQEDPEEISATFTDLIKWIQAQDAINSHKVIELREQSKKDSISQIKAKKAILHYNKLT